MTKLNNNYISFFEYFGFGERDYSSPYGFRYPDGADDKLPYYLRDRDLLGNLLGNPIVGYMHPTDQLVGALQPFKKIGKDFLDTWKPYYSTGKVERDLLQPFRGIKIFIKGIASFLGGVGCLILLAVILLTPFSKFLPYVAEHFLYPLSWMLEGVANILRGASQMVTSPLVYVIKMPLRGLLTLFQKEKKYAEDKTSIQELADKADRLLQRIERQETEDEPIHKIQCDSEYRAFREIRDQKLWDKNQKKKQHIGIPAELSNSDSTFTEYVPNKLPREVASLLYEIQRKYKKSVKDGWATRHDNRIYVEYSKSYLFFEKAGAVPRLSYVDNPKAFEARRKGQAPLESFAHIERESIPPAVAEEKILDAKQYLNRFMTKRQTR